MSEIAPLQKKEIAPPSDGSGSYRLRSIETQGQTSGKTAIIVIKEHKIFVALSESLYWKQTYFHVFDSTSIERAIAPPCDGSGSI